MKKSLITSFLILSALAGSSQSNTLHQNLYWVRYLNQLYFNDKLSWVNEIDNRRFINPDVQNQLIAHSHLHYLLSKHFEPAIGITFSWIYSSKPPKDNNHFAVPEIRPFQEITYHLPITKQLKFQQRFRVDERFIHNSSSTQLTDGYDFRFRFRFRSQLSYKVKDRYTFKLSDELMYNDRNTIYDQNRISFSSEIQFTKKFSIEISYIHINQKRSNYQGYYDRNVARLSFFHKMFLKKS